MNCYVHADREAVGTCVNCGKFICSECVTEIKGKNYCKNCLDEVFTKNEQELERARDSANKNPTVFMNAGGGGASSASSSAASGGFRNAPPYPQNSVAIHILLLLFTCGFGNLIYFLYIKSQQNKWNAMYR